MPFIDCNKINCDDQFEIYWSSIKFKKPDNISKEQARILWESAWILLRRRIICDECGKWIDENVDIN